MTAYEKYCSVVSILDEYAQKGIISYCPLSEAEIDELHFATKKDRVCVSMYVCDWTLENGNDFIQACALGKRLRTEAAIPKEVVHDYAEGGTFFYYADDKKPNVEFYLVLPPYSF